MRGYYAIVDNLPYEFDKLNLTQASKILGEEIGQTSIAAIPQEKSVVVNITASHLDRSVPTNRYSVERFKEFLQETKCTQIPKLSNHGKVYIEFSLRDDVCGEIIDHGVGVADVNPQTFLFPLGLTTENEYVTRLGIQMTSKVTQRYRPKHPYGVMNAPVRGSHYTLFIQRIWIVQIMERAWSMKPADLPKTHYYNHYHNCGCHQKPPSAPRKDWGNPYGMSDSESFGSIGSGYHPSCGDVTYVPKDHMCDAKDMVVIFDTIDCCDTSTVVQQVPIDFPPEEITVKFTYRSLLPILAAKEDIDALLADIKTKVDEEEAAKPITPLPEDPSTTPEAPPITGDDKDNSETETPGTGGGDTPGDSNETDTPIDGDDKDNVGNEGGAEEPGGSGDDTPKNPDTGTETGTTEP